MFREFVRAAGGFAGAMLALAVLVTMLNKLMPRIKDGLPDDHLVVQGLEGASQFGPLVVLFAIVIGLIAAGARKNEGVR